MYSGVQMLIQIIIGPSIENTSYLYPPTFECFSSDPSHCAPCIRKGLRHLPPCLYRHGGWPSAISCFYGAKDGLGRPRGGGQHGKGAKCRMHWRQSAVELWATRKAGPSAELRREPAESFGSERKIGGDIEKQAAHQRPFGVRRASSSCLADFPIFRLSEPKMRAKVHEKENLVSWGLSSVRVCNSTALRQRREFVATAETGQAI